MPLFYELIVLVFFMLFIHHLLLYQFALTLYFAWCLPNQVSLTTMTAHTWRYLNRLLIHIRFFFVFFVCTLLFFCLVTIIACGANNYSEHGETA